MLQRPDRRVRERKAVLAPDRQRMLIIIAASLAGVAVSGRVGAGLAGEGVCIVDGAALWAAGCRHCVR